jgi:hypothetical protein
MINPNMLLGVEGTKVVMGLSPQVPSTSRTDIVNMRNHNRCLIIIACKNGVGPSAGAITLTQSKDVANTSGKTLAFTQVWQCLNAGASGNSDTLTNVTVSGNSYQPDNTASVDQMNIIEVNETDLDTANGFTCVTVALATSTNVTTSVVFVLYPAKYGKSPPPSAII